MLFWQTARHFLPPAGEDIDCHFMRFFKAHMFSDSKRSGQPRWRGNLTNMIVLFGTQEGAQLHREQVLAAVMAGDRLNTGFKGNSLNINDADDLRGIEQ